MMRHRFPNCFQWDSSFFTVFSCWSQSFSCWGAFPFYARFPSFSKPDKINFFNRPAKTKLLRFRAWRIVDFGIVCNRVRVVHISLLVEWPRTLSRCTEYPRLYLLTVGIRQGVYPAGVLARVGNCGGSFYRVLARVGICLCWKGEGGVLSPLNYVNVSIPKDQLNKIFFISFYIFHFR